MEPRTQAGARARAPGHVRVMLGALLPVATVVLTGYALRPRAAATAPLRLAAVRAGVAVGAFAIMGVEVLSAVHAVTTAPIVGLWLVGFAASAVLALLRRRRDGACLRSALRERARSASPVERLLFAALAVLAGVELFLALVSAPNNYDSNYYHLPKIEHWVAQHDVSLYPTLMLPQVVLAPGAEYLLLHLRLLTGGDGLYNLVQWSAALGCALAASRIAAQLGVGRLGQLLAAATVASAPMVVLEATSTQNDLVVAAWVVCTATLVVDELGRRSRLPAVVGIGAAAGLVVVTKPTGWLAVAPVLLLWGLSQLRQRAVLHAAAGTLGVLVLIGVLAGPYLGRVNAEFGSPLGPPSQSDGLALERHDPPALLVNAARIAASTLVVPVPAINKAVADGVIGFAHAIGVDPQDRAITVGRARYPNPRWWPDEDHSPYPVQSALVLLATAGAVAARRVPGRVRAYALTVLGVLVLYAVVVKWQPWGNRLVGSALILGAPLVGWALPRLGAIRVPRVRLRLVAGALAVVVCAGLLHGYWAALAGTPRPLVGQNSVLSRDEWDQRFARIPRNRAFYEWAAEKVRASGARRVGLVIRGDQWEYPWWLMLPDAELVPLESVLPHHPAPPAGTVDAILCAAPAEECRHFVPPGWRLEIIYDWYGVAVPGRNPMPREALPAPRVTG
ncbi:hypothetical protein [Planosporangium mesophilum]|uniref:Glycosyltransferase RgtA/B/C/D-like domain-containing protein n=1 Tax=Planosporangium mesophilum TaxID=689768 RepID=A0A8J3WZI5_9ACTN|nr:hypothetical protein [Planosporangium mesophilum]NJC82218.1 hypothetical protein [Planosporangium mesophilum]GII22267.1 hypothetical protein Pme01_18640 [Planosporangium mesophilum]